MLATFEDVVLSSTSSASSRGCECHSALYIRASELQHEVSMHARCSLSVVLLFSRRDHSVDKQRQPDVDLHSNIDRVVSQNFSAQLRISPSLLFSTETHCEALDH